MKRILCYLALGVIMASLAACSTMGRSFARMTGQPVPVYR